MLYIKTQQLFRHSSQHNGQIYHMNGKVASSQLPDPHLPLSHVVMVSWTSVPKSIRYSSLSANLAQLNAPTSHAWCRKPVPLSLPSWLVATMPLPCTAEDTTSALMPPLLVIAALLWLTMLSSIGLQMGGAEPGVESTYWWMGGKEDDGRRPKKKTTRVIKQKSHARPVD